VSRRLYTEDDVRRMARGSELILGAGALATPSALDLARERGLRILWSEGGDAAPAPVGGVWQALASALARDGSYHVEVRDGRPRLWALGPDGPIEIPLEGN
jgi:hypothetical protein